MADGGSYTEAYARTVTGYISNYCSPGDAHAMWVGLGGWNGQPLLQNGIGSAGNVNGYFAWFEALNSTYDTGQAPITMAVYAGDTISMSTIYNTVSKSVTFSWHDQSTGKLSTVGPTSTINDPHGMWSAPTSSFYSGATGEAIDERPVVGGSYDKISNFGTQTWDQARVYVNNSTSYSGMRAVPHLGPTMTNKAQTTVLVSVAGDTTEAFHDTWQQCGAVEPVK